jgi:hypothetical protein
MVPEQAVVPEPSGSRAQWFQSNRRDVRIQTAKISFADSKIAILRKKGSLATEGAAEK